MSPTTIPSNLSLILEPYRALQMSLALYSYYCYRIDQGMEREEASTFVRESHGMSRVIVDEAVEL